MDSVIVSDFKNAVNVFSLLKYTPLLEIQRVNRCGMDKYFANVPFHCTNVPQTKFDNKAFNLNGPSTHDLSMNLSNIPQTEIKLYMDKYKLFL